MRRIFLLLPILLLGACTTPLAVGVEKHEQHFDTASVPSNHGLVYFYRDSKFVGWARGIYVTADGERVGALNSGTYFVYEAAPGKHAFSVENWMHDNPTRTIDVAAGKKYYMEGTLEMGFWDAMPRLKIVHEQEGEAAIQSLKYSTLKTTGEPEEPVKSPKE